MEVSPQLRARIDASVQALPMMPPEMKADTPGQSLWWSSSLTGLAAAMLVIVPSSAGTGSRRTLCRPRYFATEPSLDDAREAPMFPLTASTAELTEPLEDELRNLQSDLEKARDSVARDLRSSF